LLARPRPLRAHPEVRALALDDHARSICFYAQRLRGQRVERPIPDLPQAQGSCAGVCASAWWRVMYARRERAGTVLIRCRA
jgi:hypothetical protein